MEKLIKLFKNKQFLLFVIVGFFATAIDFLIMNLMLNIFGLPPALSATTGFLISLIFNFICSEHFVFKTQAKRNVWVWAKFALTSLMGLLITAYGVSLFSKTGLNIWIVKILLTAFITILNFLARKFFVFKQQNFNA